MNAHNHKPHWSADAWTFVAIALLSGILVLAFGVGFLLLPHFQGRHGSSSTSDAIHSALGFHAHEKSGTTQQEAPRIPTNIVWNESTIHQVMHGDSKRGESIAVTCGPCHGEKGMATDPSIPSLAGVDRLVLYKQLDDFRTGTRVSELMSAIAQSLTPEQSADAGAYYSSLPGIPQSADEHAPFSGRTYRNKDATTRLIFAGDPKRGLAACSACHGPGAYRLGAPGLSKQNAAYLEQQLHDFAQGVRGNDMNMPMRTIAGVLSAEEMHALAVAYANDAVGSK